MTVAYVLLLPNDLGEVGDVHWGCFFVNAAQIHVLDLMPFGRSARDTHVDCRMRNLYEVVDQEKPMTENSNVIPQMVWEPADTFGMAKAPLLCGEAKMMTCEG